MEGKTRVFISYSHLDATWLEKLRALLAPDIRNDRIDYWDDKNIEPGDPWFEKICNSIDQARIAILLVSPNFLSSTFIMEVELPRIFKAAENGLTILWIPLFGEFENYEESEIFNRLTDKQAILDIKTPLSSLNPKAQNQKLVDVCRIIQRKLNQQRKINALPFLSLHNLFKGRSSDLLKIEQHFNESNSESNILYPILLGGGSGIGKTRLAHEYAYKHLDDFSAVLFISANTPEDLEFNLIELSAPKMLDLPEYQSENPKEKNAAVIRWFQKTRNWLLIIDNVDTPESVSEVKKLIPNLGSGQIIITSTYTRWGKGVATIELGVLPVDQAMELINEATVNERDSMPDDDDTLKILVEKLGCLPLAITHAASYISNLQISFKNYIERYDTRFSKLIEYYDEKEMDYDPTALKTVSTTFSISISRMGLMEKAILRMASLLAPQPIQVSMLEQCETEMAELKNLWKKEEEDSQRSLDILEAVAELAKFSLISRHKGSFSIHRFEQSILRHTIPEEDLTNWYRATREVFVKYIPDTIPENPVTWDIWDNIHTHVSELTSDKNNLIKDKIQVDLVDHLACYYYGKGNFKNSMEMAEKAYELAKDSYKIDSAEYAHILVNTGENYRKNNKLDKAEELFREAIDIEEKLFGKDSLKVASSLNYLGLILSSQGKAWEAIEEYERALAIYNKNETNAEKHKVAKILGNLAGEYSGLGRSFQAGAHYRKAIEFFNHPDSVGPYHPHSIICSVNYASSLKDDNPSKSEEILQKTYELCKENLDKTHYIRIRCGHVYIQVLKGNKKKDEANSIMLDLFDSLDQHSKTKFLSQFDSIALNNLSLLLRDIGQYANAEMFSRKAIEIDKRDLGNQHPKIPHRLNNLGTILLLQDKLSETKLLLDEAWKIKEGKHDITSLRILFMRLLIALIEGQPYTIYTGQVQELFKMKTLSDYANVSKTWRVDSIFQYLEQKLEEDTIHNLHLLAEVSNDHGRKDELLRNSFWKNQEPVSLEVPWPLA